MSSKTLGAFLHGLRRLAGSTAGATLSDGQLLERFLRDRDEAAFEVLLWRHGPMVLGVCRRVLGHEQEVEDAFQAAFLTLVRKAGSISRRHSLGSWLYQVSHRIALAARAGAARRARRDRAAPPPPPVSPDPGPLWRDLRCVLDEEISRLPEKYRLPVVLCHLEGKTCQEAAAEMGCPVGTLTSRLTRACQQLAGRLSRRGVTLPAGALTATLAAEAARASLPADLVGGTLQLLRTAAAGGVSGSAFTLMEGVVRAMWLTKLKMTAAVALSVGMLAAGSGWLAYRAQAGGGDTPAAPQPLQKEKDSRAQKTPPSTQCPELVRREAGLKACMSCHTSDHGPLPGMPQALAEPLNRGKDDRQLQLDAEQARKDLVSVYAKIRELESRRRHDGEEAELLLQEREKHLATERQREEEALRIARHLVEQLELRVRERRIEQLAVKSLKQTDNGERLEKAIAFLQVEEKELKQAQAELQALEDQFRKNENQRQQEMARMRAEINAIRHRNRDRALADEGLQMQHQIELEVAKERYREALRAMPRRPLQETPDPHKQNLEKRLEQMSRELQELRRELQQRKP